MEIAGATGQQDLTGFCNRRLPVMLVKGTNAAITEPTEWFGEGTKMLQREVTIVNRLGLHARAAVKVVSLCSKYVSSVVLVVNGRRAEGRRMMAILMLSATVGSQVLIQAQGPDEKEAIEAVTRLISNGFGEG
jgi:phosphocarrier protein